MEQYLRKQLGVLSMVLWIASMLTQQAWAQDRRVTGRVIAGKDQQTIPGVTILVKNTQLGTTTDAAGNFSLNVPANAVLVVSAIGYVGQDVAVGNQSQITVTLQESEQNLSEVVVTALGIKKDVKKLGYATATVNPEQLTVNRTTNFGNSLQGRVAGLNVNSPPTGAGGSSKIRIRGQSSFSGQNTPLIVVNGIPINNSNFSSPQGDVLGNGTANSRANFGTDQGDGLNSINPDDVESVNVLKGAPAAALYGFRAKDGVIIITTKSGKQNQGIGVDFTSNLVGERAADYTDFQYQYGQGERGLRPGSDNSPAANPQETGHWSFGAPVDGQPYTIFNGQQRPYSPVTNRINKFFQTGYTWTNTLGLSGGNDKGSFRLSFTDVANKSIVPNSSYNRRGVNLGISYNLSSKLSVQTNVNYTNENYVNPPVIYGQSFNITNSLYTLANTIPLDDLRDSRKDANGNEARTNRFTPRTNPYWSAYDRFENVRRDRIFGNISLRYQFTDWLYAQVRVGQDFFNRYTEFNTPTGTQYLTPAPAPLFNGGYYQGNYNFRETNYDFLVGASRKFGVFGLDLTAGGNQLRQKTENSDINLTNFAIRDQYRLLPNGAIKDPTYYLIRKQVNSIYGSAEVSYKDFVFLNATLRNDWFSTLNPASNSYLYPSLNGSVVISQAVNTLPTFINYLKVRGGYAEVGADNVSPYSNNLYYGLSSNTFPNATGAQQSLGFINTGTSPNPNLRPLKVKEAEAGIEMRLFSNRVNLDFGVYNKNTIDDILPVQISNASGYGSTLVNVGRLRNRGIEMLIGFVPVRKANLTWDVSLNTAYNETKVLELAGGQTFLKVGDGPFVGQLVHEVGQPLASLQVQGYRRVSGNPLLADGKTPNPDYDPTGQYVGQIIMDGGRPANTSFQTFGSAIPKWVGGLSNTITFKGIRLYALIDYKFGNKMISSTNFNLWRHGLHKETLYGRDQSYTDPKTGVVSKHTAVFPGAMIIGKSSDGSTQFGPNTVPSEVEEYYLTVRSRNIGESFVYNAGYVKLRQVSIGYDFSRFFRDTKFVKGVNLSIVANNVLIIKKWVPNIDPEQVSASSDNLSGLEGGALPLTRQLGFNLNLRF